MLAGVLAALALLAVVGALVWRDVAPSVIGRSAPADLVVIALACEGESGVLVTPVVALLDTATARASLTPVDPLTTTTIPGTTYDQVWDAYAFGGGAATADALGRSAPWRQRMSGSKVAHIVVPRDTWEAAVDARGGIEVDSPRELSVFTGTELLTFPAGVIVLDGRRSCEYLKTLPYLTDTQRDVVSVAFADALAAVLADPALTPASGISTDLAPDTLAGIRGTLGITASTRP